MKKECEVEFFQLFNESVMIFTIMKYKSFTYPPKINVIISDGMGDAV